ncbi:RNA polymerase sigma factor [Caulobacter sp. 1776]|uniref:RNA polymerase sigma factor n=1 Tax=Caulobacter sp. 1776 TaxID=3156420 RepID=UPI00339665FA
MRTGPDEISKDDDENDLAARSRTLRGALTRYFQRRLPNTHEADDLVQEVFLRIVRRGDSQDLDQFEGYVFQTAASVIKDRFRRRRTRKSDSHVVFEPDLHGQSDVSPEQTLLAREALKSTTRAIMAMPERTRTIFVLRRLEGLSHPEIARRLGVSLSTVEKHIQRAAKQLLSLGGDSHDL